MKTKLFIALTGALALGLTACEKKDEVSGMVDTAKKAAGNAADATKDAANKAADATKDAATKAADATTKAADATKDAAIKTADATKDAATKAADAAGSTAANAWETLKSATMGDQSKVITGFESQIDGLAKKIDTVPAPLKDQARSLLDGVRAQVNEADKLIGSLKGAGQSEWKGISDKATALFPQIKSGLEKITAMLPK